MFPIFAQRTVLVVAGLPTACFAANSMINNNKKNLIKPSPSSTSSQLRFPSVERSNGGI
ncbi:uncharacterized protein PGTG_14183 [Puccinia graminis f. sp. tritici CRL 75-36-700-3]|uniref:Uncharacterized protein n=1 Tax=Puccinia graminis f. sp. tritici (strain CRL 75-36-700-3 / race SCCL) TaxID=418459 RepID=E3KX74_PUCGT|nr:uncharacterized protein PGTG_14183 [Puccinia graminis f. sp. tritici CRL 75-36-700-3]EFP88844.1 hypothetical protein PGTG_14183 [Puccinia graminis f. sp. tritici CRL 75-36-700-3]